MNARRRMPRFHWIGGLLALVTLLLACSAGGSLTAARTPRWACPSPVPKPYGESGPVKGYEDCNCTTDPLTGERTCDQCPIYYAEWEQEYADRAGPPFPSPTPYALTGTAYTFGQLVEVWPVHVAVQAENGPLLDSGDAGGVAQQLYLVRLAWFNHTTTPIAMDYATRLRLRSVTNADGRIVSGATWGMNAAALQAAALPAPPQEIAPGTSTVMVPILGPIGTAHTVEVVFDADPAALPVVLTATTLAGTATPTVPSADPRATATPNTALANTDRQSLVVQWSNVTLRGPACDSAGATTSWGDVGDHDLLINPPPAGTSRLLQIALNQVGKPYRWGAKGPESFDCSGLTQWSYGQIGIRIPTGTAGQWPQMRPVTADQLQPGDLIFFAIGGTRIDHVGLVGDFNADGQWDVVHAASPELGVRVDYTVLQSRYYQPRIRGFRTVR